MTDPAPALGHAPQPLLDSHDLVMFDLDGVLYIGDEAVPGAADGVRRARAAGAKVAFVTNNAARPPGTVAERLTDLGIEADADDVVTSAQAAAGLLAREHGPGARVLVLGARGLVEALEQAGLVPVPAGSGDGEDDVVALATGYGPDVRWRDLMRVAVRLGDGLPWVASNPDMSLPAPYGTAPGHGVQVRMLADFSGATPQVAGKPERALMDETVRRLGGRRPLVVGDRLDTDIEGARAADLPSLLVLTGVTGLRELVAAGPHERPTYLHPDLRGLHEPHPRVTATGEGAECGGWRAVVRDGRLAVDGQGSVADWWRAVAVAGWGHLDAAGTPADVASLAPPVPGSGAAAR